MTSHDSRATRVGAAVVALSLVAWAAVLVAHARIPSPAHETRFVRADGRALRGHPYCHGMIAIDGEVVWSVCQLEMGSGPAYLARFAPATGTSTLLGPLPSDASGLGGAIVGPSGERVFRIGDGLFAADGNAVRRLGRTGLPLGLARVGDGIECVERGGGTGLAISRYERGGSAQRREIPLAAHPAEQRASEPIAAFFEDGRWHVLVQEYSRVDASIPLAVTVHDQDESGASRVLGVVRLDEAVVHAAPPGTERYVPAWLDAGALLPGSYSVRERHVYVGSRFERVRFDGAPYVDVVAMVIGEGARGREMISDLGERRVRISGEGPRVSRVHVRERFDALRVDGRTGPPVVASFWMDPGFRAVPLRDGGFALIGALGGSYVRLDRDLRRTDDLSFAERFGRLFVEDRAKHNSDFLDGFGVLRVLTVPFALAGVLVGAAVFGLRPRRPRVAVSVGMTWIALALLGAWHFAYVLRYFW